MNERTAGSRDGAARRYRHAGAGPAGRVGRGPARALVPGIRIAEAFGCPVELVTVYDPVHDRWEHQIDELAAQLGYEQVEVSMVGGGRPGEVIAEMAAQQAGTHVCMSAMHVDEFDRLVLGSVSAQVLRTSTSPTVFVGPTYQETLVPQHYRRLVVGLDGSSRADAALNVATTWAQACQLDVELVRVVAPDEAPEQLDSARRSLAHAAATLTAGGISATVTVLTGDNPAARIAELLGARSAAFALTATHGRTGLGRLLLGSVTTELLSRSPSPVLVTRSA